MSDDDFPMTYVANVPCNKGGKTHTHMGISSISQADARKEAQKAQAQCKASGSN
jgi:hypothetical protein